MALVRVLLDNGWEATVDQVYAAGSGLTILDKPAVNRWGRALPALPPAEPPTPAVSDTDDSGACPDVVDLTILFENGLL